MTFSTEKTPFLARNALFGRNFGGDKPKKGEQNAFLPKSFMLVWYYLRFVGNNLPKLPNFPKKIYIPLQFFFNSELTTMQKITLSGTITAINTKAASTLVGFSDTPLLLNQEAITMFFKSKHRPTPSTAALKIGNQIDRLFPDNDLDQMQVIAQLAGLWAIYDITGKKVPPDQAAHRIAQLIDSIKTGKRR